MRHEMIDILRKAGLSLCPALVAGLCHLGLAAAIAEETPKAKPEARFAQGVESQAARTNSLGMVFKPAPGSTAWFCIWETRVQDYEAFIKATDRAWTKPGFDQAPNHPVANVNWEDARAFCDWLTKVERASGRITGKQRYRLPTDQEWSAAAGLASETGRTPETRMKTLIIWPWGGYWPPQAGDGNYGPEVNADAFANTAPVGSFKPNHNGLYDLGGSVWEWCEDWYNEAGVTKVLRGGSFNDSQPACLLASYRFSGTMNLTNEDFGCRVVLEAKE